MRPQPDRSLFARRVTVRVLELLVLLGLNHSARAAGVTV